MKRRQVFKATAAAAAAAAKVASAAGPLLGPLGFSMASRPATAQPLRGGPQPLVVWFTVRGAQPMRAIAERFTAETGVPVVVETPDEGPAKFQQAASAGKGPDIYIYAHDRIGEWIAAGLLHEIHPSRALREDIDPLAWRGFSLNGRTWGYPYAIEAITLSATALWHPRRQPIGASCCCSTITWRNRANAPSYGTIATPTSPGRCWRHKAVMPSSRYRAGAGMRETPVSSTPALWPA